MKALKQFSIPFTGLKLGKHDFDFEIDKSFFDAFEHSLVKDGALKAMVELDKQETMLILGFHIEGTIKLNCDTCLSDFDQQIELNERQIVKFAEEVDADEPEDLEIIVLPRKETAIDVSELIYEFITVAVPFINKCEQAGQACDEQMLNTLEKLSAGSEEQEEQSSDPRWEALKKLK
ncbi:MAG: YceD family protein [Pedobacter sp.]